MSTTAVNIESAWAPTCAARIRISVSKHGAGLEAVDKYATVSIDSGAAGMQLYLTPVELEELESMCALARKELRDMAEVTA